MDGGNDGVDELDPVVIVEVAVEAGVGGAVGSG